MSATWWTAIALVLLIEGAMPLLFPKFWQAMLRTLSEQSIRQFRRIGGALVVSGLVILWWISKQNG